MVRVLRNLDPALYHCPVPVEFLCILSNYNSGGRATRVIHFSLLVFSTVPTTLSRQETITPAIRNYSFRLPIKGRLTFREYRLL